LQILCRSKNKYILTAWSTDNGKSWSNLKPIELPNPNSGTDAVTLKSGKHVLVYNHIHPNKTWGSRNMLNMAVSDDGINWKAAILLENDPDNDSEYSYPAVIQSSDGMIHITYTWNRKLIKHVLIDPKKLVTKPISNGIWPVI
jgi:predicted neuraminidase